MKYKLSDISEVLIGRTPPRKEPEWFSESEGYKWISIKDMGNENRYIYNTTEKIIEAGQMRFNIPIVEKDTLLLSFKLTVGRVGFTTEKMLTNEAIAQIVVKESIVDKMFLYYYLKNYNYNQLGSTSSIATAINSKIIKNMEIDIPDITIQKKIATILDSLDKRIEINNAINKNLQDQVDTIFKSWFVKFEKHQGTMPATWKIKTIKDLSKDIICGKTPSTKIEKYYGNDIPFITIPDMHGNTFVIKTERYLSTEGANSQKNKYLPKNSVCVSCIGTAGLVSIVSTESQTNQQINSIIPKEGCSPYYIYLLMKTFEEKINKYGQSGSTIVNLNKTHFEQMEALVPSEETMSEFDVLVSPMFSKILNNQYENLKLAELRDSLLPKLMSGEIDVTDLSI